MSKLRELLDKIDQDEPYQSDNSKPKFVCEECGMKTDYLKQYIDLWCCQECNVAIMRRERFKREEKEWNNS